MNLAAREYARPTCAVSVAELRGSRVRSPHLRGLDAPHASTDLPFPNPLALLSFRLVRSVLIQAEKNIHAQALLDRGEQVLVAVSGGIDSIVLAHVLLRMTDKFSWRLAICHFNHQLRGRASDADARFVARFAKRSRLPFYLGEADVAGLAKQRGTSIEMAGREARHEFFASVAQRLRCRKIALGHHADDQLELFFLRLLRGTGLDGLSGMKWIGPSPVSSRLKIIRPLLNITRAELEKFAAEAKLSFREDATNQELDYARNRIRHELLPLVRRLQPAAPRTIARLMATIEAEHEFVRSAAAGWLASRRKLAWDDLEIGLQREIVRQQLIDLRIEPEFELIETLRISSGKPFSLDGSTIISRGAKGRVEKSKRAAAAFDPSQRALRLDKRQGEISFDRLELSWRWAERSSTKIPRSRPGREHFDGEKVGGKIILRHWRPGDRFQAIGTGAAAKLQDLFVNAKIPREERRHLVVATTGSGEIFWVERLRIGERFKLTDSTHRVLRWEWRKRRREGGVKP